MAVSLIRRQPGELPAEVTSFIGRQAELAQLDGLLKSARLVTVTGPGGVGKTRVALRAAARAAGNYRDGVCLIELSGLRDPELLAHTFAAALGLPEQDARSQLDAVLDHLRERNMLLILDTCEHLLDACAMLADTVVQEAERITVLATSRQPLDIPGEYTCPVSPLPVPEPGAAQAGASDAVELFAQRAATVVPGFTVTDANRDDVIRLCRCLDGIPLAIELATVRLRALPIERLAERLAGRFRVLTVGRRAALPRHQTLRTAIEWSYDLCIPAERALWARLSVFAGTFDIDAAEEVCAGGELDREDIVETLIGLVDKSVLLRVEDDGGGYRLLDTLREFGAGQLAEVGGQAVLRDRHIARYLRMAEYFGRHFADDQLAAYRALRREHANIRAALEYALDLPGRESQAARLATALYGYWHISGMPREGRYWLTRVLERFPDPSPERAWALIVRCYLVTRAREDGMEGISIAERLGEELIAARGYLYLHTALAASGRLDEAARAGATAAERLQAADDRIGLLCLDAQMAQMHAIAGDLDRAIARCAQGLRRADDGGELWSASYMHYTTGLALFRKGEYEAGAQAEYRALAMKAELGDALGIAHCLEVLAWIAVRQGRHGRASWLFGAAGALWARCGRRVSGNPVLEEFHRQAEEAARQALGEKRYAALHAHGAGHQLDQVITCAASDSDELGQAIPERGEAQPDPLTSREREIAELVSEGLSNREIAERLVISKRTVDAHVEHIFEKLDISSRVQLATWLKAE
jgi:predicted ATPase/DNA-binding CsgD family transcriptional regulator